MFKNSLIASIFVVFIHMARNHFITHDGFPVFFVVVVVVVVVVFSKRTKVEGNVT